MYYLKLKFEDAGLILNNKNSKTLKGYTHIDNAFGVYNPSAKGREIDYEMPIGISQISNMFHVMLGFAPKPTYRKSFIKRNEEIYNIAKKARIRYYDGCDENIYEKSEVLQGSKAPFNSHATKKTKIGDKIYDGFYTWSFFLKRFDNFDKKELTKILSFFNQTLGCDDVIKKYTFPQFVLAFEKYTDTEEVKNFIKSNPIYFKFGGILLSVMSYVIFKRTITVSQGEVKIENKKPTGTNTSYNHPTPLFETKDVNQRVAKLSGEIMIEFEKEEIIERLHRYGIQPTLLDGGLVSVMGLYSDEDDKCVNGIKKFQLTETYYKLTYKEISEQKGVEITENQ